MSVEQRKVLEMLSEKKISLEDAERLLAAIKGDKSESSGSMVKKLRFIRITVDSPRDKVDIRVPIQLLRAGMKLSTFIPEKSRVHVERHLKGKNVNFDFNKIRPENIEDLIEALSELSVNVEGHNGEKVRIFCE